MSRIESGDGRQVWGRNTAAGRWYGLGRWYAMFPSSFARDAIMNLSHPGETVLDPFCGRGIAPFAASVLGRASVGIDIHPLAWLWTSAKLSPEPNMDRLLDRLAQIARAARTADRRARNRFERMAWSPNVRAFLRAARRELDWQDSVTDRTLMAFVALHAQDKYGAGLSNQLSPTLAYSPSYAIQWWIKRGFLKPPPVDPSVFLTDRIARRYKHGIPDQEVGTAHLGDSREVLRSADPMGAGLLVTSPPYRGMTDYWNEHWIRLWLLGYDAHKNWKRSARQNGTQDYRALVASVFREAQRHVKLGAAVLVRCDQRRDTATACVDALTATWPGRRIFARATEAPHAGVSSELGRGGNKARELDLLIPGRRGARWLSDSGFSPLKRAA